MAATYQVTTNDMLQWLSDLPMTRWAASKILTADDWDVFMRSPRSPKWFNAENADRVLSLLMEGFTNYPAAIKQLREGKTLYCEAIRERFKIGEASQ